MESVLERRTRGKASKKQPNRFPSGDQGRGDVVPRRNPPRGRRPLADVTNDSPVAGMFENSPAATKASAAILQEGEALLRSQVQSLLEGNIQLEPCKLNSFVYASPCSNHGGPTPANTPAALLADPSEDDDDGSSNWSVDVNVSSPRKIAEEIVQEEEVGDREEAADRETPDPWAMRGCDINLTAVGDSSDEKEDEEEEEEEIEVYDPEEEEGEDDEDLCCEVSEISLAKEKKPLLSSFAGKHIRFKYSSDGEETVEEEIVANPAPSPSVIALKGLPLPTGKHQRFPEDKSP